MRGIVRHKFISKPFNSFKQLGRLFPKPETSSFKKERIAMSLQYAIGEIFMVVIGILIPIKLIIGMKKKRLQIPAKVFGEN